MKALKHVNKYFYKYRWQMLVGILITIVARVFSLVTPPYINKSIAAVEVYMQSDSGSLSEIKGVLITHILIILGAALSSGFFTFLMRQTIINVSRYIEFDLKNEVYDHYQKLDLSFYKKNRTGDLMNRISEDVAQVRMYAGPAIMYSMQTLTLFVCVVPIMFIKAPQLAMYTLIPLPVLSYLIYRISKMIHNKSNKVQEFLSDLSTFTQEAFSGIGVIKAYSIESRVSEEMKILSDKGRSKAIDLAKINAWFFPLMLLLIGISNLVVIYIGGRMYLDGRIETIGVIAEFIIYVNMLTWPVAIVGWVTSIVQRAEVSQKRINDFLHQQPTIQNAENTVVRPILGNLRFEQVSFTYKDTGIQALKNVSFEIQAGETVAFIGKTGSGKSTLLELIARLYDADTGSILLDGVAVNQYDLAHLRGAIGFVPQDAILFSDSIENNIRFGKADADKKAIEKVAKDAAVHQNIIGFKEGYQTVLGERGITLSGGQKQRISIARALLKNPAIFLFDDCLSAVDTETEEQILSNLNSASVNKTTILVSHRISSAKNADKVFVLDQGAIIQQGTHDQLIEEKGYYKELYLTQLSEKEM
ncbi:MAG: ABC transporter ATP-binding protein/permease [Flavobacteriaceae bacterium]|nr:ABC transporter ATP-binding protein/permease [Flavobacteriaceae bacterium]